MPVRNSSYAIPSLILSRVLSLNQLRKIMAREKNERLYGSMRKKVALKRRSGKASSQTRVMRTLI